MLYSDAHNNLCRVVFWSCHKHGLILVHLYIINLFSVFMNSQKFLSCLKAKKCTFTMHAAKGAVSQFCACPSFGTSSCTFYSFLLNTRWCLLITESITEVHWMTRAQIWWKILQVYTANIKFYFGLQFIVRVKHFILRTSYLFACSWFITQRKWLEK